MNTPSSSLRSFTLSPPDNYNPIGGGAGCICVSRGEFLLLKRSDCGRFPGQWCNPGGKSEPGETKERSVQREVFEEIGLDLSQDQFEFLKTVYISYLQWDYAFHLFRVDFGSERPVITLNEEHSEYRWLSLAEVLNSCLMPGERECYQLIYTN